MRAVLVIVLSVVGITTAAPTATPTPIPAPYLGYWNPGLSNPAIGTYIGFDANGRRNQWSGSYYPVDQNQPLKIVKVIPYGSSSTASASSQTATTRVVSPSGGSFPPRVPVVALVAPTNEPPARPSVGNPAVSFIKLIRKKRQSLTVDTNPVIPFKVEISTG